MKDSTVPDSGNIYFGDPSFGTLECMKAFLYAENNFYDYNLNASGSAVIELDGNMTAGNQVLINRDYTQIVNKKPVKMHNKLKVAFDPRIADGTLDMPGLPKSSSNAGSSIEVLSWRGAAPE